jgi:hypothetical protein
MAFDKTGGEKSPVTFDNFRGWMIKILADINDNSALNRDIERRVLFVIAHIPDEQIYHGSGLLNNSSIKSGLQHEAQATFL